MNNVDVITLTSGKIQLLGELNFTNVVEFLQKCQALIDKQTNPVIDLQNVTRSDSSGLALLIALIKYCKQHSKALWFINIPQQLLAIAKVSNLDKLLPVKE